MLSTGLLYRITSIKNSTIRQLSSKSFKFVVTGMSIEIFIYDIIFISDDIFLMRTEV
jgi:hypothetical protein